MSGCLDLACSESVDDALPELLLARLGATHTLQQFVELHHAARRQTEGGARVADDRDELVEVGRRNVVDAMVHALRVPAETRRKR